MTVYCNKDLVSNIKRGYGTMKLDTNARSKVSDKICMIPDFKNLKDTWFNEEMMTNIILFTMHICPDQHSPNISL